MRFLKLTRYVINTSHITCIHSDKNMYTISTNVGAPNGFMFWGFGHVQTKCLYYTVKNDGIDDDYKKVQEFIDSIQ